MGKMQKQQLRKSWAGLLFRSCSAFANCQFRSRCIFTPGQFLCAEADSRDRSAWLRASATALLLPSPRPLMVIMNTRLRMTLTSVISLTQEFCFHSSRNTVCQHAREQCELSIFRNLKAQMNVFPAVI